MNHPISLTTYCVDERALVNDSIFLSIKNKDYNETINLAHKLEKKDQLELLLWLVRYEGGDGFEKVFTALDYEDYTMNDSVFLRAAITITSETDAYKMSKFFLEKGCDVRAKNDLAIKIIAQYSDKFDTKRLLLEHGADIHVADDYVLRFACQNTRSVENINFWLENGANIHVLDDQPLRIAVYNCQWDIMIFLIEQGSNPVKNCEYILRECFIMNCESTCLKKLFDLGLNIDMIKSRDVITAIRNQYTDVLKVLAELGYDFTQLKRPADDDAYEEIFDFLTNQGMDKLDIAMLLFH